MGTGALLSSASAAGGDDSVPNSACSARGMRPRVSSLSIPHSLPIVYVLPEPVWPYAITVTLKPCRNVTSNCATVASYSAARRQSSERAGAGAGARDTPSHAPRCVTP